MDDVVFNKWHIVIFSIYKWNYNTIYCTPGPDP